jgi:hypothetical protein
MNFLVSSMIEDGVAVNIGGACGGFRSFRGAMVEVVTGLVAEEEFQGVGDFGGLVCDRRAERRAEIRSGGARMREKMRKRKRTVR